MLKYLWLAIPILVDISYARAISGGGVSNLHQEYFYQAPYKANTPYYTQNIEGQLIRVETDKVRKSAPYKSDFQIEKDKTSKIVKDRMNLAQTQKDPKRIERRIKNVVQSVGSDSSIAENIQTKEDEILRLQKKLKSSEYRKPRTSTVPGTLRKTSFPGRGQYAYFPGAFQSSAVSDTRKSIQQQ